VFAGLGTISYLNYNYSELSNSTLRRESSSRCWYATRGSHNIAVVLSDDNWSLTIFAHFSFAALVRCNVPC
jgi:hypothetical protein